MKLSLPSATVAALLSSGVAHFTDPNIGLVKTDDAHQTKLDHNMVHEVVCLPSATLAALLPSGLVPDSLVPESLLSTSQAPGLAQPAVIKKKVEMQGTNTAMKNDHMDQVDLDARSIRLKKKLKAKSDLRMKSWSQDVYLVKTTKHCTPAGVDELRKGRMTDVGVLDCELPESFCIEDTMSSLGGTCAQVLSVDNGSAKGVEGLENKGGNKYLKPLTAKDKMKAKSLLERN
jgi:hypothetical protein